MRTVHILHEPWFSENGAAFLFPLRMHARRLRSHGIRVRFFQTATPDALSCDTLCVSSRFARSWWRPARNASHGSACVAGGDGGTERVRGFLRDARRSASRIVWFDITDSTGTTQFPVLPVVDRYVKGQVLRDRRAYLQPYYGARVFTDFVHRQFGITDADADEPHLTHVPAAGDLAKVVVGWNSGLAHYGRMGAPLAKWWWHFFPASPRWYPRRWDASDVGRLVPVSCRIRVGYSRATVAEPRRRIRDALAARGISTEKLARGRYFDEMRHSVAAVTPFGLGEISLRDFEVVIAGAAMVKQDMSHLETWPNLWESHVTYLPFRWDLSDFDAQIERVVREPDTMRALARAAQERYRRATITEEGAEEFCTRFAALVS